MIFFSIFRLFSAIIFISAVGDTLLVLSHYRINNTWDGFFFLVIVSASMGMKFAYILVLGISMILPEGRAV